MLIQVLLEIVPRKKISNKKITVKLNLALYSFLFFDPLSFEQLKKEFSIKRKTKKYARKKVKYIKWFFSKYFVNFQYNSKQNNQKDFLILKNYLNRLQNLRKRQLKPQEKKNLHFTKLAVEPKNSFFLLQITYLEDFLNV